MGRPIRYGMWFEPGFGMHVDNTSGVATGNDPESIYAVMSGKNFNGKCCFDYGNSEKNDKDDGSGTMEAIYFGNAHWQGANTGVGSGPWVGADLEEGMYYGGGNATEVNSQSQTLPHDFVSLTLKGRIDGFTLKGGDATRGKQTTMYDGPRPFETGGSTPIAAEVTLEKCIAGDKTQTWAFRPDGLSIASGESCLAIRCCQGWLPNRDYKKAKGSSIWGHKCGDAGGQSNQIWALNHSAVAGTTIQSGQPDTPFCVGIKDGTTVLDNCTAPSSVFTIGFTNRSGGLGGTIVQSASGLCLTVGTHQPAYYTYQPMKSA